LNRKPRSRIGVSVIIYFGAGGRGEVKRDRRVGWIKRNG